MKGISALLLICLSTVCASTGVAAEMRVNVIYGEDNRQEPFEVTDQGVRGAADATVAIIDRRKLTAQAAGLTDINTRIYGEDFNLCKDEPYYSQPTAANCSGFLVGEDLIATAGHCIAEHECGDYAFVFGFEQKDKSDYVKQVSSENVYNCKKVLSREMTYSQDYALIQVDRKVTGHTPLKIATRDAIAGDKIVVMGHPSGLPLKIAGDAQVRRQAGAYFVTNLDTFGGNSGSAVLDAQSLEVLGILVRGETDFSFDSGNSCARSYKCANGDCRGEDVTNISFIEKALKAL